MKNLVLMVCAFATMSVVSCKKDQNNSTLKACFTNTPSAVVYGQEVTYDGSCSKDAVSYYWEWQDGASSSPATFNGQVLKTTIYYVGNTDITLVVSSKTGQKDTIVKTISVQNLPASALVGTYEGIEICSGSNYTATITILSGSTIGNFSATYSDGTSNFNFTGTYDGYFLQIPNQNVNYNGAQVFAGSGSYDAVNNKLNLNYSWNSSSQTFACSATLIKK